MAVILGKNGGETLTGGSGNDTITGGTGNDRILTGDGSDSIDGGDGNDQINGYPNAGGAYTYWTYEGTKIIDGGNGDDFIYGADNSDSINGGNGNDSIYGSLGDDSLNGGAGNDFLVGAEGADSLLGGEGNDTLSGGSGNDSILAGAGDDVLNTVSETGNDTVYGGDGNDLISFTNIEGNKLVFGESGNDSLTGGNGNDTLEGGPGNDRILSGDGSDSIDGGDGNDQINGYPNAGGAYTYWTYEGTKIIDGGIGDDFIYGADNSDSLNGGNGNDSIYGSLGDDSLNGGTGNDFLVGDEGADSLLGGEGNDTLSGGSGNDSILAGAGDDVLNTVSETGNDTVYGGDGNDLISFTNIEGNKLVFGESGNDSLNGGNGNDTLEGGTGNDILFLGNGNDSVTGGEGDDQIYKYNKLGNAYLVGDSGNDTIQGGLGNDTVAGGYGNDSIIGWSGDDSIAAGDGDDYLSGSDGNDTLDGGSGNDSLFGGAGNDTYYINSIYDYVYDSGGSDAAYVSASFVKLPSTIENVNYIDGAQPLPYWIDAMLPDEAAGLFFKNILGNSTTLKYVFPSAIPSYDTVTQHAIGYSGFTERQISRTKEALSYVSTLINLQFIPTSSAAQDNTIAFANNTQTNSAGYARLPGSDNFLSSDVFLDKSIASTFTLNNGQYQTFTLIHEIGHALGLEHPFSIPGSTGSTADSPHLTSTEDSTTWTVMSYTDNAAQYYFQYSPLDIAALQYIYGPSTLSRTSNDTYKVSQSTANFIWDGAGTDTVDISTLGIGSTIYLTPGYWGFVGAAKAPLITGAGQITVNFGSLIENLIGSAFADKLYGNETANSIDGGSDHDLLEGWNGDDTLLGGAGNDSMTGGAGNDSIDGGDGIDTLTVSGTSSNYIVRYDPSKLKYLIEAKTGNDGKDIFSNIEFISFSNKSVLLSSLVVGTIFNGTNINETINGTLGDDQINGEGGTDTYSVTGTISDYTISYNRALSQVTLNDKRNSSVDNLLNIEKLQFADKTFDLINLPFASTPTYGKTSSFLFDSAYYLLKNPDLVPSINLTNAFDHYIKIGAAMGKAPNTWFDPVYYANKWSDLKPLKLDAATLFMHYNLYGVWEGRGAGPAFDRYDGNRYLKDNPDVAAYVDANVKDFLGNRVNGAIAHYIIYGANESRTGYDSNGQVIDQIILIGTIT